MKLFDMNILINAQREENAGQAHYHRWLTSVLEGEESFLYCERILSSFIRIVTHPGIYKTPTPLLTATEFAQEIRRQPHGIGIMPGARHWAIFTHLCRRTRASGNLIPDAYFAALAIEAQAEWITADKDYAAFEPDLTWRLLQA